MSEDLKYKTGPAAGGRVEKNGEAWTLVMTRDLRHPPSLVWQALTEPEHLAAWAPFDAEKSLGAEGKVTLTTAGAPPGHAASEATVKRVEEPRLLEYDWGGQELRWQLEPLATGTRLTLWHNIDRRFIAWGAAGWHVCFDVMDRHLAGDPIGRIVGPDALKFSEWKRLNKEYAAQFGVESPEWSAAAAKG